MGVRVLQVLGRSAGGIAKHVAEITSALDGRDGFTVDIAGPTDLPVALPKQPIPLDIPAGAFGHRGTVSEIRSIAVGGGYDVVHAHGLRAGIDAGRASGDIPAFVTVHNLVRPEIVGRFKAALYSRAEALVVRYCDRVFCVSADIYGHLRSKAPRYADKVEVTYLGIEEPPPPKRSRDNVRRALGVAPGESLIVTAARLSPQKALPVMFEAVRMVPAARLAVLGDGPQRQELMEKARDSLGDRVSFLGFRDDVIDHIRAADVFCLSSIWEGVPLSVQEAVLVGTPVVATWVGGLSEMLSDEYTGRVIDPHRLVPPNDPQALAEALTDVLTGSTQARDDSSERARFLERFSKPRMLEHLRTAYAGAARGS